jgi:mono/diheme cytochrome c family protein
MDWRSGWGACVVGLLVAFPAVSARAEPPDPASVERGRVALTTRGYIRPGWKDDTYQRAGAVWGESESPDPVNDPESYAAAFNRRYGFHPAPYPNGGLPMGLRRGVTKDGQPAGLAIDCLACHGGSIGGTSYVGLGNTRLDMKKFSDEMAQAEGRSRPVPPFVVNTSRGTVNAGMMAVVLFSLRNDDLSRRVFPLPLGANLPELDVPPWWNLRKKATMYYDGRTPADSVRANMQFLLGDKSLDELKALEPVFRDIQAYLKSLTPPKYPFPIDQAKAERGRVVFESNCSKCHGTYGPDGRYPNRIVELSVIGTDPARALGISERSVAHYNATWFGEEHPVDPVMVGYQAPPLDGVWASAPYLHNGSVPTIEHLLNSSTRPRIYKRPPSTDFAHYDRERVGWTFEPVESPESVKPGERGDVFDSSRFGLGNGGHTFGDKLTEPERAEVIEYLKTL